MCNIKIHEAKSIIEQKNIKCPICQNKNFDIVSKIQTIAVYQDALDGDIKSEGTYLPSAKAMCKKCGFIGEFNLVNSVI
jgi:C4-type Zn-finger protein